MGQASQRGDPANRAVAQCCWGHRALNLNEESPANPERTAYLKRNAEALGLLIISSDNNCQGFRTETHRDTNRRETELSGPWLVAEQWVEPENIPF